MNVTVSENSKSHYEANQPRLQWLLILIPVAGIFALYTAFRIRYKRRKRQQLEEENIANIRNTIHDQRFRRDGFQINNCSEVSLVRIPQGNGLYVSVDNNTESRRGSSRLSAPPPIYSMSSPPKYEDVVDLRKDHANPNST